MYFTVALRDANNCLFYVFFFLNPFDILFSAFITLSAVCSLSVDAHCLYLNLCSCLSFAALICALIPILMARNSTLFPDKNHMYEVCIHFRNISSVIVFLVGLPL